MSISKIKFVSSILVLLIFLLMGKIIVDLAELKNEQNSIIAALEAMQRSEATRSYSSNNRQERGVASNLNNSSRQNDKKPTDRYGRSDREIAAQNTLNAQHLDSFNTLERDKRLLINQAMESISDQSPDFKCKALPDLNQVYLRVNIEASARDQLTQINDTTEEAINSQIQCVQDHIVSLNLKIDDPESDKANIETLNTLQSVIEKLTNYGADVSDRSEFLLKNAF